MLCPSCGEPIYSHQTVCLHCNHLLPGHPNYSKPSIAITGPKAQAPRAVMVRQTHFSPASDPAIRNRAVRKLQPAGSHDASRGCISGSALYIFGAFVFTIPSVGPFIGFAAAILGALVAIGIIKIPPKISEAQIKGLEYELRDMVEGSCPICDEPITVDYPTKGGSGFKCPLCGQRIILNGDIATPAD